MNPKKFVDSCPLDEVDLIKFMTVNDSKEVDNDEVEGLQLLTAGLIREGLKFAASMEQPFPTHNPGIKIPT
ncbi:hypothetical protein TNCV_2912431 [Trichonephila clavipes]|nr:hypothetical protein TNCV_2912431 [Trichonephila clavipes]